MPFTPLSGSDAGAGCVRAESCADRELALSLGPLSFRMFWDQLKAAAEITTTAKAATITTTTTTTTTTAVAAAAVGGVSAEAESAHTGYTSSLTKAIGYDVVGVSDTGASESEEPWVVRRLLAIDGLGRIAVGSLLKFASQVICVKARVQVSVLNVHFLLLFFHSFSPLF